MVAVWASGVLGVVALGAGMLVAAPASAGMSGQLTAAAPSAAETQCVGVAPTWTEVLVRAAWTETALHPAVWVTEARHTRWVIDQPHRPGVPEVRQEERRWSGEPIEGWAPTGVSRFVVTRAAVPGTPGVEEQTEQRMVDPGRPAIAPTVELIEHPATTKIVHHPAVVEIVHHEAVLLYEFEQRTTDKTRWETDPGWNAQGNPKSEGWSATGASKIVEEAWDEDVVVEEAWDEEVIVKDAWVEERVVDPGQEYVAPTYEAVVVVPHQPPVPAVPEQGYTEHEYLREVVVQAAKPEVAEVGHVDELWTVASPGAGWTDTGETRRVVVKAPWTESVDHPAEYEARMTDPGVVCPLPGVDGAGPGTPGPVTAVPVGGAGPVTTVPVGGGDAGPVTIVPVKSGAGGAGPTARSVVETLPTTGADTGLVAAALLVGGAGAALLAGRSVLGRTTGAGRHRLDPRSVSRVVAGAPAARRDPARRGAHRRTA